MTMRIVLIGGGGHASDVLGALEALDLGDRVAGILADDEIDASRFTHRGVRQIGQIADLSTIDASHYIVAVGYPPGRKAVAAQVADSGRTALTVVHPRAWVPRDTIIGEGSVILAGVCVSPCARIGRHVYVSVQAVIGHDCQVGDFASVMPHASVSGDTVLGEACLIGSNATVLEKRRIGEGAVVGAGSVVTKDVAPHQLVVGIPARPSS